MILRPYQQRAVAELRAKFAAGFVAPVCNAPTGAGKTVIASEIIRLARARGNRCLFLVPRIELLNQSVAKLAAAGITDVRSIQAHNDVGPPDAIVTVASIPTLTTERWLADLPPADLVLMDECHRGKARTYEDLLSRYPHAKRLGLTATVQRGDGRALDNFDCIVTVATVRELVDAKALVPCVVFAPARIMDSREVTQDPVDAYVQRTPGQKAIVFCASIVDARDTCARFLERGIKAKWLSGESRDRDEVIAGFARRDFDVLVNVSILIEGFDDPETSVAILAKRFTHVGSFLQAIGRILRPHPSKQKATVLDLCGSALVHGTPDMDRTFSLDGKGISSATDKPRYCRICTAVLAPAARVCPECNYEFPAPIQRKTRVANEQLDEVTAKTERTSWPMPAKRPGKCATCGGFLRQGEWIVYSRISRTAKHPACAARRAAA